MPKATSSTSKPTKNAAFDEVAASLPPGKAAYRANRNSLNVEGKVFAMMVKGNLVVKLSPERIAKYVAAGTGAPYEMAGRVMKEWIAFAPGSGDWKKIAREALDFVSAKGSD